VVFTVKLAPTAAPLTWTRVEAQVGAGLALVETAQARVTVPSKPPVGVTVVEKVAELPAVTVPVAGLGVESEKLAPAAVTVKVTITGWTSDPEVPVTVMG
jgi:hypothetical protein